MYRQNSKKGVIFMEKRFLAPKEIANAMVNVGD